MPYAIERRGAKWHVVNTETGEDKGGSETEEMAKKHLAALYAHEPRRDGLHQVRRFDVLERLDGPKLLPNGWLRADAHIARTGIQEYRRGDGSVRREYRPEEVVFDDDALESFAMVPVTDEHPVEGFLTAENTAKYQRGHLGETVRRDGAKVRASLLVTDGELVKSILAGKQQLSCGYTCDLDETPGEWQGQRFDAIQRNVRGNHVAVVAAGRAGPEVRVKLDTADAVSIRGDREQEPSSNSSEEHQMGMKIKIDGIEVEVANEQGAALIERALKSREDIATTAETATKAAKDALSKETARADTLDAKLKETEKARQDAADPKRITAAVKARVALESQARGVLGADAKLDELDDLGVKKAVLAKIAPGLKLDGKDSAYVDTAYETAVAQVGEEGLARLRQATGRQDGDGDKGEEHLDADELRGKFVKDTEDAWKKPTVGVSK